MFARIRPLRTIEDSIKTVFHHQIFADSNGSSFEQEIISIEPEQRKHRPHIKVQYKPQT